MTLEELTQIFIDGVNAYWDTPATPTDNRLSGNGDTVAGIAAVIGALAQEDIEGPFEAWVSGALYADNDGSTPAFIRDWLRSHLPEDQR